MTLLSLFIIAVGLSMDAFAVAICKGLTLRTMEPLKAAKVALFFGVAQAVMPVLGWLLAYSFQDRVVALGHWIAFILLCFIGAKMIHGALGKDEEEEDCPQSDPFAFKDLAVLAIATSIDAMAVGVSFAFLDAPIVPAASFIGVTTFILSFLGVYVGKFFGVRYRKKAEIFGGIVLIAMGVKIILEHLGVL